MATGKGKRELKTGFSTGAAAAAAAKAALSAIRGERPDKVELNLPGRKVITVGIADLERLGPDAARAAVIKLAGDDPDVTNKARVEARVEILPDEGKERIEILGGPGVGVVTLPGLPVEVGEPAINPGPRRIIRRALHDAWEGRPGPVRVRVEISVPKGEELAERTLNPRLGIVGGISILGNTGLVVPFSHGAYTATIAGALKVARASGVDEAVFTTGRRSEKRAMELYDHLPELAFVQIADFFGFALERAVRERMTRVNLVAFFGKALKQARGLANTHAHRAPQDLGILADWLSEAGAGEDIRSSIAAANTGRHALELLTEAGRRDLTAVVGRRLVERLADRLGNLTVEAIILDYDCEILFRGGREGGSK
jgi:cobalt-precorrin-5B (C1)-methyltransferase